MHGIEQGVELLDWLAIGCWVNRGSTWQVGMGWPDIHWLARDQTLRVDGLVAAINDVSWVFLKNHAEPRVGSRFSFLLY
jgi:hypothetical protein